MRNLCEYINMYVRKYTWPKLRGVAMCVCVRACERKKAKFNSKAISWFLRKFAPSKISRYTVAFQCQVYENWERIGYVVREALDSVHAAMDSGDILKICFDWVKYIVQFKDRGFYAGILITRRGEWPQSVMQCRAKSFV